MIFSRVSFRIVLSLVFVADGAGFVVTVPVVAVPGQGGFLSRARQHFEPAQRRRAQFQIAVVNQRVYGVPEIIEQAVDELEPRGQPAKPFLTEQCLG